MNIQLLKKIAAQIVAPGKGLLAADESVGTANKRLASVNIEQTEENRRRYRDLFLGAENIEQYLSGVILYEETLNQKAANGKPFHEMLSKRGIIPGIKVDKGAKDLAGFPGEQVTEGLDGLRERLQEFRALGCGFAKWRAVIAIKENELPTNACILANAHAMARYAALCQENDIVPIVEPEVLLDGDHSIERCEAITTQVLKATFEHLEMLRVMPEGTVLKASMVLAGNKHAQKSTPQEIGAATVRTLKATVPQNLGGVVFLSGGQSALEATQNLDAINKYAKENGGVPWQLSFSYARALQGPSLETWRGNDAMLREARSIFVKRLKANSAARMGSYSSVLEK